MRDSQLIWPETTGTRYIFTFKFRVYVPVAELVANCCETGSGGWTTSEPCVVPFRSTKHSDERRQSADEAKKRRKTKKSTEKEKKREEDVEEEERKNVKARGKERGWRGSTVISIHYSEIKRQNTKKKRMEDGARRTIMKACICTRSDDPRDGTVVHDKRRRIRCYDNVYL